MAKICPHCGASCEEQKLICPSCGRTMSLPESAAQPPAGVSYSDYQQKFGGLPVLDARPQSAYPMGWFRFIIYFQLFASAVLNFLSAFGYAFGTQFGEFRGLILKAYPAWSLYGYLFAALSVGQGILALYTRSYLAGFRKSGPKLYYVTLACSAAVEVLYTVVLYATGLADSGFVSADYTDAILTALITIGMLAINLRYFGRRRELFRN